MTTLFAISLLCLSPVETVRDDRCDVLEVNHLFDAEAEHILTQLVLWSYVPHQRAYRVVAWRLVKGETMQPQRVNGEWVSV